MKYIIFQNFVFIFCLFFSSSLSTEGKVVDKPSDLTKDNYLAIKNKKSVTFLHNWNSKEILL